MNRSRLIHFVTLFLLITIQTTAIFARSKTLTFTNKSTHPLYGAVYYTTKNYGLRATDIVSLPAAEETIFPLPPMKLFKERMLYVASTTDTLPQKIDFKNPAVFFATAPLGVSFGRPTHVIYREGVNGPQLVPASEEQISTDLDLLRKSIIARQPHCAEQATVTRTGTLLSPEEEAYAQRKTLAINARLQELTGKPVNIAYTPTIALSISGGGFRAMLASLGVLGALEELQVLPLVKYAAGISGGTWALMPWIVSKKPILEYVAALPTYIAEQTDEKMLINSLEDFRTIRQIKELFGGSTSMVDLYGIVLSKRLIMPLVEKHFAVKLSGLAHTLTPALHPIPLCAAVMPYFSKDVTTYDWFTMSPWRIEHAASGYSIPTWATSRHFNHGMSYDSAPEPLLGHFLGVWGSAFSASIEDILKHARKKSSDFARLLPKSFLRWKPVAQLTSAKQYACMTNNFLYGIHDAPHNYCKQIALVDGAHACNLPVAPFLHPARAPHLIIMIHSDILHHGLSKTLRQAEDLLRQKYPDIELFPARAIKEPVSYWPSSKPGVPHVLHISIKPDSTFDTAYNPHATAETQTTNFWYTKEQAEKLIRLMKHTVHKHKDIIMQAVNAAVEKAEKETGTLSWIRKNVTSILS